MRVEIVHSVKSQGKTQQKTTEFSGSPSYAFKNALEFICINSPILVEAIRIIEEQEDNGSTKSFRTSSQV